MTLWDAILAVLGGIWAFVSAPLVVLLIGGLLAIFAFIAMVSFSLDFIDEDRPLALVWIIPAGVALILLGIALVPWGLSSASPFEWVAR